MVRKSLGAGIFVALSMSVPAFGAHPRQADMRDRIGAADHMPDHHRHAMRRPFDGFREPLKTVPQILQEAAKDLGVLRKDRATQQKRDQPDQRNRNRHGRDDRAKYQQSPTHDKINNPTHGHSGA